jgi:hypothetical protein
MLPRRCRTGNSNSKERYAYMQGLALRGSADRLYRGSGGVWKQQLELVLGGFVKRDQLGRDDGRIGRGARLGR